MPERKRERVESVAAEEFPATSPSCSFCRAETREAWGGEACRRGWLADNYLSLGIDRSLASRIFSTRSRIHQHPSTDAARSRDPSKSHLSRVNMAANKIPGQNPTVGSPGPPKQKGRATVDALR